VPEPGRPAARPLGILDRENIGRLRLDIEVFLYLATPLWQLELIDQPQIPTSSQRIDVFSCGSYTR
jgi:hypothetical protein